MEKNKYIFIFLLVFLMSVTFPKSARAALQPFDITTLDTGVTYYASFGSYNQKIVQNQYGIFLTYKITDDANDNGVWRLLRSIDGGKTFNKIYEANYNTKPPVVETDGSGVIYLATGGTNVSLYRFLPQNNFANPVITSIPNSGSGKMSMIIDERRGQLYFFSHYAYFSIIGLDGTIRKSYQLGSPFCGPNACYQYPLLTMDENGNLIAAWTTIKNGAYLYWDIHFIISKDGGNSWQKLDGTHLNLPLVPDNTGSTDRVTLDDEFNVHTWLSSVLAKNGKIYFPYLAQFTPYRQHFARYDLSTAKKDLDVNPVWKGETLQIDTLHGFCATKLQQSTFPIYCIGNVGGTKIGVIVSSDQGATWHDYAESVFPEDSIPWSIAGAREITPDGYMIGTYTSEKSTDLNNSQVRFFRVKVGNSVEPSPPAFYWPMDETTGNIVNEVSSIYNGTTTAGVVDGKIGKARNFISTAWTNSTRLQFPLFDGNINTKSGFSVEAWIKKNSSSALYEHRVIGNRYNWNDANGWYLTFPTNENIAFSVQSMSNPSANLYSTQPIAPGTWYHVVGVYDNGTIKLYINGVLDGTLAGVSYTPSYRELTIGGQPDTTNYGFDGIIDEVHFYPFALSADIVKQHYLGSGSVPTPIPKPGDLNNDGKVDFYDYNIFVGDYGKTGVASFVPSDIDKNGKVDFYDYNILVGNYGK